MSKNETYIFMKVLGLHSLSPLSRKNPHQKYEVRELMEIIEILTQQQNFWYSQNYYVTTHFWATVLDLMIFSIY